MLVSKKKLLLMFLNIFLFLLLQYVFIKSLVPHYSDNGFFSEWDLGRIILANSLFLLILLFVLFRSQSDILLAINNLIVIFFVMPNLIVFQNMGMPADMLIGIVCFPFILALVTRFVKIPNLPVIRHEQRILSMVLLALVMLMPFVYSFGMHLNFRLLLFSDVYEVREESEQITNVFSSYFYSWLSNWIFPAIIIFGMWKNRKLVVLFGIMGQLYLFLITGNKITYLIIFLVFIFYIGEDFVKKSILLSGGFVILVLSSVLAVLFFKTYFIESLLIRRFLFIPAILNLYYYDFFDGNHLHLSHSIFSSFLRYPYPDTPQNLIGAKYFYKGMSANNGIFSDGFMNFGFGGIVLNVFLASIILAFIVKAKLDSRFFSILIILIVAFNSSALLTTLLTHGVLLLLLVVLLLLRE